MAFAVRLLAETPLKFPDRIFKPLRLDKTVTLTIPAGVTHIRCNCGTMRTFTA